jgi:hypothetical protein
MKGGLELFREKPVVLRIPIIEASDAEVWVSMRSREPAARPSLRLLGGQGDVELLDADPSLVFHLSKLAVDTPWIDLEVRGHRQRLTEVDITLPVALPVQEEGCVADPLDGYGDPLAQYDDAGQS